MIRAVIIRYLTSLNSNKKYQKKFNRQLASAFSPPETTKTRREVKAEEKTKAEEKRAYIQQQRNLKLSVTKRNGKRKPIGSLKKRNNKKLKYLEFISIVNELAKDGYKSGTPEILRTQAVNIFKRCRIY